jgi:hypothetical protein
MTATRIPIEKESVCCLENMKQSTTQLGDPSRCAHIGDRDADLYKLFRAAKEARTQCLARTCVDRLTGATTARRMVREPVRGEHEVAVRDEHGQVSAVRVGLRYCRLTVHPPVAKQGR